MDMPQVQKVLIRAVLDPAFRDALRRLGPAAGTRFGCAPAEDALLTQLLADDGAGLDAVVAVADAATDTRLLHLRQAQAGAPAGPGAPAGGDRPGGGLGAHAV